MASAGGVWKTTNGGANWTPVSDGQPFGYCLYWGGITVADSYSDIVYVGTGEYDIRGNVSIGDGVYKPVDGGQTWNTHWPRETPAQISRIHRSILKIADIVYVGRLFRPTFGDRMKSAASIVQKKGRRQRRGNKISTRGPKVGVDRAGSFNPY